MNSIIGIFFILGLRPSQVFFLSVYYLEDLKVSSMYTNEFQMTYKMVGLVKELLKTSEPQIDQKLESLGVKIDIVVMKWLLTGFTDYLSIFEVL